MTNIKINQTQIVSHIEVGLKDDGASHKNEITLTLNKDGDVQINVYIEDNDIVLSLND
jgi:hypothetical protein